MKKCKIFYCTLICITIILFCCSCKNTTKNNPSTPIKSDEDKNTNQSEHVTPGIKTGTKENPLPFLTTTLYNGDESLYDSYHTEITLIETIRGEDALSIILNASKYNTPPPDGKEYLLAKFRITVLSSKDDAVVDINTASFSILNENGILYDSITHISNLPESLHEMYAGATQEGYVCFTVNKTDSYPYIVFLLKHNGGLWFTTNPNAKLKKGSQLYTPSQSDETAYNREDYKKGTRKNPVRIKETISFDGMDTLFDTYRADITINEILRGESAYEVVPKNALLTAIDPDKELLLARVTIASKNSSGNTTIEISQANFELVSEDGIKYEAFIAPTNDPQIIKFMNPFQTQKGYLYFLVNKKDLAPKIVFLERNFRGLWFETTSQEKDN